MSYKDIFIDNDCASKHFSNPVQEQYKDLIRWLIEYEKDSDDNAYLVVSQKLLVEYNRSCRGATSSSSMPNIIAKLTKEQRIIKVDNASLKALAPKILTKKRLKKLTCNKEDHAHIITVLVSDRKMALTEDQKLFNDLVAISGYKTIVAMNPNELNYRE